jgi:hypothetical protein
MKEIINQLHSLQMITKTPDSLILTDFGKKYVEVFEKQQEGEKDEVT